MVDESIVNEVKRLQNENHSIWDRIIESGTFKCTAYQSDKFAYDKGDRKLFDLKMEAGRLSDRDTDNAINDLLKDDFYLLVKLCVLGIKLNQIHTGLAADADDAIRERIRYIARGGDRTYRRIIIDSITEEDKNTLTYNNLGYLRSWNLIDTPYYAIWENEYGGVDWDLYWEKIKEWNADGKDGSVPEKYCRPDYIRPNGSIDYKKLEKAMKEGKL